MDNAARAAAPATLAPHVLALSQRDADILTFERQWWRYAGAKEDSIRELFSLSATQYYQVLNSLIDTEAALAHDPMLVKRLRRMRAARTHGRARQWSD